MKRLTTVTRCQGRGGYGGLPLDDRDNCGEGASCAARLDDAGFLERRPGGELPQQLHKSKDR